jgi:hypothetical protein
VMLCVCMGMYTVEGGGASCGEEAVDNCETAEIQYWLLSVALGCQLHRKPTRCAEPFTHFGSLAHPFSHPRPCRPWVVRSAA